MFIYIEYQLELEDVHVEDLRRQTQEHHGKERERIEKWQKNIRKIEKDEK
jgi:hypothetical protein